MFARTFHSGRFVRRLAGTEPFGDYCQRAEFPEPPTAATWADALTQLPADAQARIEMELGQVNELSGRDGNAHLLAAAGADAIPPPDVPAGPAVALWYFLHHPDLFQAVFLHHEIREARAWRSGRSARDLAFETLTARTAALADGLRAFFRLGGGDGRFCAVDARPVEGVLCFTAHIADRIRLLEGFTERGELAVRRVRPALTLLFTYAPCGQVRLRTHLRAVDRVHALFQCFGNAVLSAPVQSQSEAFHLDRLKYPFRPLPDGPDMEMARVKALALRYPARLGRREVRLTTRSGDSPGAIEELLAAHAGSAVPLHELRVAHAELQVRLRYNGRGKDALIRLWPDRSSLNDSPLGRRLSQCLRRWGLADD
jgi:hypothetical protein